MHCLVTRTPKEVWQQIADRLDSSSRLAFGASSRFFYAVARQSRTPLGIAEDLLQHAPLALTAPQSRDAIFSMEQRARANKCFLFGDRLVLSVQQHNISLQQQIARLQPSPTGLMAAPSRYDLVYRKDMLVLAGLAGAGLGLSLIGYFVHPLIASAVQGLAGAVLAGEPAAVRRFCAGPQVFRSDLLNRQAGFYHIACALIAATVYVGTLYPVALTFLLAAALLVAVLLGANAAPGPAPAPAPNNGGWMYIPPWNLTSGAEAPPNAPFSLAESYASALNTLHVLQGVACVGALGYAVLSFTHLVHWQQIPTEAAPEAFTEQVQRLRENHLREMRGDAALLCPRHSS